MFVAKFAWTQCPLLNSRGGSIKKEPVSPRRTVSAAKFAWRQHQKRTHFPASIKFSSTFFKRLREIQKGSALLAALRRERNPYASENAGRGEKIAQWAVFEGEPTSGVPLYKSIKQMIFDVSIVRTSQSILPETAQTEFLRVGRFRLRRFLPAPCR